MCAWVRFVAPPHPYCPHGSVLEQRCVPALLLGHASGFCMLVASPLSCPAELVSVKRHPSLSPPVVKGKLRLCTRCAPALTHSFLLRSRSICNASSAGGDLPHDPTLGIGASVWASMGPQAQVTAQRAGLQRQKLAEVKVLTELGAPLTTAAALDYGVKVLRAGPANSMALGVFDLPLLYGDVVQLPKGASIICACRPRPCLAAN